ncbi:hypothetical protein C475_15979 [Halosimplex carlsbadense 2-9-1]|uniref:Uncharacterized protein n=1 Tax=Halosimplex carlsbadense 2-9-1 TaxID=797114 RepID=M0CKL2_9EURY|nr:hypothetical protein [Halosimplex carlsbadense]ELZ23163.1 hypothetical protein C475_15979 [Halosimplex carlsbadense 2-9-1]
MASSRSIQGVEQTENYYHVRYRDPDEFDEIRTPDWAANVAGSVVSGAEVRTGDEHGNEDWTAQSVLVPVDGVGDESAARDAADEIVAKMES